MNALRTSSSRSILSALVDRPKSVAEVSREQRTPIASAYRHVNELVKAGLVVTEQTVITDDGKKYYRYRAAVRGIGLEINQGSVELQITPNEDAIDKLARHLSMLREVR